MFIVEDGTGVVGATSYCSEDDFDNYTEDRNYTVTVGDTETALVRATQVLDAIYRRRYPGTRTFGRGQSLEWPRTDATDVNDVALDIDEIPEEIIAATCELALRELASPGSTMPDLERGGDIRRLAAGSVSIEYGASASVKTVFSLIDGIMSSLIGGGTDGGMFATTTRG